MKAEVKPVKGLMTLSRGSVRPKLVKSGTSESGLVKDVSTVRENSLERETE